MPPSLRSGRQAAKYEEEYQKVMQQADVAAGREKTVLETRAGKVQ